MKSVSGGTAKRSLGDSVCARTRDEALEKLKQERIVGAIGLGSNSVEFPGKLAETGRFDVIEIANGYTLLSQAIEDRILPAARKHDLGVIAGDHSVMVC